MKFDLSRIEMSKRDIKRRIKFPKFLNKKLAEFIGIMMGDGHLGFYTLIKNGTKSTNCDIKISGNRNEEKYLRYVRDLFYSLFNLKLKYAQDTSPNAVILRAYSKGVVQFLNNICGIPLNRKTNIANIPEIIKKADNDIKYAFLRGLADTDFIVTFQNRTNKGHNYPVIKGSLKSKILIQDLERLFKDLEFKYSICYDLIRYDKRFGFTTIHGIYLYGKENFRRWVSRVGFSNPKFIRKVEKWQNDGVCPPGY